LTIQVVDQPPVLDSLPGSLPANPYDTSPATLIPGGSVFMLVAANLLNFRWQVGHPGPVPAEIVTPAPTPEDATASANQVIQAFLTGGRILRFQLEANDPPEELAELVVDLDVGTAGNETALQVTIPIRPHFRLVLPPAGQEIAQGDTVTLPCRDMANNPVTAGAIAVTPEDGVTVTANGTDVQVEVADDAATGPRVIVVADANDAERQARRTIVVV
jgi:hypothetical protein